MGATAFLLIALIVTRILHLSGAYRVVETEVKTEGVLEEKPLRGLDLGDLLVLGVHRADGE